MMVTIILAVLALLTTAPTVSPTPQTVGITYTMTATVYGHEGVTTLFEDSNGNVWAYVMPYEVRKGEECSLTLYDEGTPDVTDDRIMSINIDGYHIHENATDAEWLNFD